MSAADVIRCGIFVTGFYLAALVALLLPAWGMLARGRPTPDMQVYAEWFPWIWVVFLVGAQVLLLFLSVDTSRRIFRQRRHVAFTAALVGVLTTVLVVSAGASLWVAMRLHEDFQELESPIAWFLLTLAASWLLWAALFYLHFRGSSRPVDAAVRWLLRGSVLELLVAVPSHIVAHRRGECTEPAVTGYGVVTGLALMLLAFGPGILSLYRKRIDEHRARMQKASA